MPFDPISWIIIGFVSGALTACFWDEITEWADRTFQRVIDFLDRTIEEISDRVVYLATGKSGKYEKQLAVYYEDQKTGQYYQRTVTERIDRKDIPADILKKLDKNKKLRILQ